MVQYDWNQNRWESLSEMEWDANTTQTVKETNRGCSNAVDTLPFGLILKESANSSLSVWTQKAIEKGTKFGPLQGEIITDENSWKLRTAKRSDLWPMFSPSSPNQISHYIDTSPLFGSNWMRYVAFPGASCPHNLVACQVENSIYFFARENISPFTELKVWFHPNFFDRLKSSGIHKISWNIDHCRLPHQPHQMFESMKHHGRLQSIPFNANISQNCMNFLTGLHTDIEKPNGPNYSKLSLNHRHTPSMYSHNIFPLNGFFRRSMEDNLLPKSFIHQNLFSYKNIELDEMKINKLELTSSKESSPNSIKEENLTPLMSTSFETCTNSSNYSWNCSDSSSKESMSTTSSEERGGQKIIRKDDRSLSDGSPDETRETRRKGRGIASLPYELPRANGKTIYECRLCKKVCAQLSNLKVHMYTHTGERPFACPQCPSRFTQKAHLHKHMSTHTGVKPFSCSICGKKSASSSNIKAHMKVHENR